MVKQMSPRLRRVALLCVVTAGLSWTATAAANPFDVFGAGTRSSAMGGAMTAASDDWSAIHHNLGAMAFQGSNMGFGLSMSIDNAQIRLKPRPSGFDLPDLGSNSPTIPSSFRLRDRADNSDMLDLYGFYFGIVGDFGIEDLRVGALIFTPINRLGIQQTHYVDEREQYFSNQLHFELLGARLARQVIMLGASYRLADWLGLGVGISFLPAVEGVNRVFLNNPTDQSSLDITLENDQIGRVAPVAGIDLRPTENLSLGLAYRGELFFSFDGANEIQIRGFQDGEEFPIIQEITSVQNYTPHQVTFGMSYQVPEDFTVSVDVVYAMWSGYLDHQGQRAESFDDTFSFRLGGEFALSPSLNFRGGLGFESSPVQEQTGRTNFVDNDRLVFSVGAGHPLDWMDGKVELSWYMQLHHLLPRDTNKDPTTAASCEPGVTVLCDELPDDLNDPLTGVPLPEQQGLQTGNPGFPGFQSFGQVLSVGLDLRWKF